MKTLAINLNRRFAALSAVVVAVGLAGSALRADAQSSPGGGGIGVPGPRTWDFVLSGNQRGLAQITFNDNDFTLTGAEIITFKKSSSSSSSSDNPRGGPEDDSRGDTELGSSSSASSTTNYYGMATLTGSWTYDTKGRVIGYIAEGGGTNTPVGISFRAVVRGNRITMTGARNGKKITYRGVPQTVLADQSGNFYGEGKASRSPFVELLTLAPGGEPNFYEVTGAGPAYTLEGYVMVSAQKQLAFVSLQDDGTSTRLRSITGSYNVTRGTGSLKGLLEVGSSVTNVTYKLVKQP